MLSSSSIALHSEISDEVYVILEAKLSSSIALMMVMKMTHSGFKMIMKNNRFRVYVSWL